MYGYVKPKADELTEGAAALYRALGCGLCRAMRRLSGPTSALSLRNDLIFLSLCRLLAEGQPTVMRARFCPLHPFRRRRMVEADAALLIAAAASAEVAYLKMRDDLADGGPLRRLRARITLPFAKHAVRRAARLSPGPELAAISTELAACERESTPSLDRPADLSGRLMAAVFSNGAPQAHADTLYAVGYHLGRFVYLADALDDFAEDKKRGSYNPYVLLYGEASLALCEDAADSLFHELSELCRSAEPLRTDGEADAVALLDNILRCGLSARVGEILAKFEKGATT